MRSEGETHYRTCSLCEAMCGLSIEVADGQVQKIKGDELDTFSRGHLCPKATALASLQNDPDRLRSPMRRTGTEWTAIDWDEALEEVTDRLAAIHKRRGGNAIGIYAGNPSVHNYGVMTHSNLFLKQIKSRNRFSASSVDQMPHQLVAHLMYGHQFLIPSPDIDHTDWFLMLGANPIASNGSLMTVPDVRKRLLELKQRGKLVVIDPRRTETAELACEFHFIRPGSDAAFLAAMLATLFEEGLTRPGRLTEHLVGWQELERRISVFSPERVAAYTGIEAGHIRRLAREMAAAPSAVCYGRMGLSTQVFGSLCQWLLQLLNIAAGNLDRPGGALFTRPAMDMLVGPPCKPGHFGVWHSRVSGLPEFAGELPAVAMAEEMSTEGEHQIRAMITVAGNPVLSTPNGPKLEKALAGLDFMVSVDLYLNETTRFADIILPPTSPLEHDHFDIVFNLFAVRNTVKFSEPTLPKPKDAKHDWEIFVGLAEKMAPKLGLEPPTPLPSPDVLVDMALRAGPYGADHELDLNLAKLKQHPHGLDLGPLESSIPQRLFTPDKKINCLPARLVPDLDRLEADLDQTADPASLLLIGRRHLRSNNSWMHNCLPLVKGARRDQLWMHPDDLAARQIQDGDTVSVRSRTGIVQVTVLATDAIKTGVVSLPHGWGHNREGTRLSVARQHAGVSVNDLTDEKYIDPISGNAAVNGVPVLVAATASRVSRESF